MTHQPYPPPAHPPTAPPPDVTRAQLATYAGAALTGLGLVVSLISLDDTVALIAAEDPATGEGLARASVILQVIVEAVVAATFVAFAALCSRPRQWARVTLTVLCGIALAFHALGLVLVVLFGLDGTYGAQGGLLLGLGMVQAVLAVAVVVSLFRAPVNAWIASAQRPRPPVWPPPGGPWQPPA